MVSSTCIYRVNMFRLHCLFVIPLFTGFTTHICPFIYCYSPFSNFFLDVIKKKIWMHVHRTVPLHLYSFFFCYTHSNICSQWLCYAIKTSQQWMDSKLLFLCTRQPWAWRQSPVNDKLRGQRCIIAMDHWR